MSTSSERMNERLIVALNYTLRYHRIEEEGRGKREG